ncbi:hypothetical protein L2E82_45765 [Cichorium intybus]|uniref:Uncharacterized protein n=1 Tax=Cichorium intybus TaxID=13427 RepID=A0ACB8ZTX6_CICIN|nr:hypothetical protein L2E82_45765 [Cichorium intybus]
MVDAVTRPEIPLRFALFLEHALFPYYHRSSGEVSSLVSTAGIDLARTPSSRILGLLEFSMMSTLSFSLISIPGRNVYVGVLKLCHSMLPDHPDVLMYLLIYEGDGGGGVIKNVEKKDLT